MTRRGAFLLFLFFPLLGARAEAQSFGAGTSVGAVKLANGVSQTDVNAVIGLAPAEWLAVTATLSRVHITQAGSGGIATSDGLGDLPISVGATRAIPGRGAVELGASFDLTLPTGNSADGLGTGSTSLSAGLGIGASPTPRLRLAAAASRSLTGDAGTSALSPARATSLAFEGQYALTSRWTGSLSLAADVGPADSALALDRSIGVGARYAVHGPVALTLDAARDLSETAPRWALVLGFGTTFGGNNPSAGELSAKRIAHAVSKSVGRGQGSGKIGHGHP
ncbi:MAG: hypothetical protein JF590_03895 [Gemmatimonadetes bacterium]|nr:hypothetical protein [Gemmatimonadota bacterium]